MNPNSTPSKLGEFWGKKLGLFILPRPYVLVLKYKEMIRFFRFDDRIE